MAHYSGLIPPGFQLPKDSRVHRTGKQDLFPGVRVMQDTVQIDPVDHPGFVQLSGAKGARIHGDDSTTFSRPVKEGATHFLVQPPESPGNSGYQVIATPNFDMGNCWITDKTATGFTVNFKNPAPVGAMFDFTIHRDLLQTEE
jgi:hypothetical protein